MSFWFFLHILIKIKKIINYLHSPPHFPVFCFFYFLNVFIDYTIAVVPFLPLHSTPSCPPPPSHIPPPPQFMSMGHTYQFFGFYISYTILTLPLSILHLSCMFILCTFPPSPAPTLLLITLHVSSISVVPFLFQLFAQFSFVLVLGVVVNNCQFAVIVTVHIFYLLFLR